MQEKDLKLLRSQIDLIDDQLLELIIRRSSIVDKIGALKKSSESLSSAQEIGNLH